MAIPFSGPLSTMFGGASARAMSKDGEIISQLRSELRRTQAKLEDAERRAAIAEADNARMRAQWRRSTVIPHGDAEEGYECPNRGCYATLTEDYVFCPGCGAELDWGRWRA